MSYTKELRQKIQPFLASSFLIQTHLPHSASGRHFSFAPNSSSPCMISFMEGDWEMAASSDAYTYSHRHPRYTLTFGGSPDERNSRDGDHRKPDAHQGKPRGDEPR